MKQRLLTVLIALDVFVFALLTLGSAKRNETISACAWSMEVDGKVLGIVLRPLIDWLMTWLERDHCRKSYFVENKIELWNPPTKATT